MPPETPKTKAAHPWSPPSSHSTPSPILALPPAPVAMGWAAGDAPEGIPTSVGFGSFPLWIHHCLIQAGKQQIARFPPGTSFILYPASGLDCAGGVVEKPSSAPHNCPENARTPCSAWLGSQDPPRISPSPPVLKAPEFSQMSVIPLPAGQTCIFKRQFLVGGFCKDLSD